MRYFWNRLLVTGTAFALAGTMVFASHAAQATTVFVNADGTPIENCTALRGALNAIRDNKASNRYLIKLDAGVYDCEVFTLGTKPYVDLEGSGINTTKITSAVPTQSNKPATLYAANNSEIRNLTIENTTVDPEAGTGLLIMHWDPLGQPARITNVAVGFSNQTRIGVAIRVLDTSAILDSVTAEGWNGAGIVVDNADNPDAKVVLDRVTAFDDTAGGRGLVGVAGSIVARNSNFRGDYRSVDYHDRFIATNRALFVASELDGQVVGATSHPTAIACIGSYDAGYNVLPADCGAWFYSY